MAAKVNSGKVVEVDFEGVETGGARSVHIPEGDYGFKSVKVEMKKGEDSGEPYILFHMKIIKGNAKGVGKTLFHNCSLQKKALWNLRGLLEAFGKTVPSKAVKIDLDKLLNLECAGSVIDDEYKGKPKSVIASFFPLAELSLEKAKDDDFNGEEKEEGTEEESEELFS